MALEDILAEQTRQARGATQTARNLLAFEIDERNKSLAKWEALYGSVEQNLSNYYESVTPEVLAATGLKQQAEIHQQQVLKMQQRAAQRGFDSPAAASLEQEEDIRFAESKAEVRSESETQLRGEQQNFLTLGIQNQLAKDQLNRGIRDAQGRLIQTQQFQSSTSGQIAGRQLESERLDFDVSQAEAEAEAADEARRQREIDDSVALQEDVQRRNRESFNRANANRRF